LGAVIKGHAGNKLLTTYNIERQPVGAYYAHLSGEMAAPDGLVNYSQLISRGSALVGLPDYKYNSEAIVDGLHSDKEAHYFTGQPGTRLPHLWLDEQKRKSTLDWIKGRFILIITGARDHWETACTQLTNETGITLPVYSFGQDNDIQAWQKLTLTETGDALLIRPDGFVACRLSFTVSGETLIQNVKKILAKV
jgi:putative polyketide hydroxylase